MREIGALAPFGHANRRPTVRLCDVQLVDAPRPLGSQGRHLAVRLRKLGAGSAAPTLRAVWWGAGELTSELAAGQRLEVAIEPKLNYFNGRTTVEGEVRDVMIV